jgi:hypothetical protein
MMPPNVSMMGGAGGQQGGQPGPGGMYDQGGPGPGMMGGMPGADGYGGANGGQYGPPRMANHYNQPPTSAPNQYDNRSVHDTLSHSYTSHHNVARGETKWKFYDCLKDYHL